MWYVKNELGIIFYKNKDVRKTQAFAIYFNDHKKIPFTKYYIKDFTPLAIFKLEKIENKAFVKYDLFGFKRSYESPFNKKYDKQHKKYLNQKLQLLEKLAKKYHLWSYNSKNRKCNSFDF